MGKGGSDVGSGDKEKQGMQDYHQKKKDEEDMRLWGILIFGFIGATATTYAFTSLRRTVTNWIYSQNMSQSSRTNGHSFRSSFQEESWKRYNRRLQEEYEEELERVERIRRMQSVFNRERNKFKRSYESWQEHHNQGWYHQQHQRDDWYWKGDNSFRDESSNFKEASNWASSSLSHHYLVLGLDRQRTKPYTDCEIKKAFQEKAKQYHPDQNQHNKQFAEAKFKELMVSHQAIKSERQKS